MDDDKGLIIYNTPDGRSKVALMARDGMVWLNQQSIAELFGTSVPNISMHISNIFKDNELDKNSVIKDYLKRNSRNTVPSLGYKALVRIFGQGFYNG